MHRQEAYKNDPCIHKRSIKNIEYSVNLPYGYYGHRSVTQLCDASVSILTHPVVWVSFD